LIEVHTLEPGRQTALEMAGRVAAFLDEARLSLDLALYDLRLPDEPGDIVAGALRAAAERGVAVRIAYNADHDERVFPPPPRTKPELLQALRFPTVGIPGIPDLMHHKYAIRDGRAVWTGSTNWTIDSWTLQENLVVTAASAELAGEFGRNFEELWRLRTWTAAAAPRRGGSSSKGAKPAHGSPPGTARSSRTESPRRSRPLAVASVSRRR
jgi:phosphatidylserine/phosphatidylglycerophosphate/cardiolipin synthase-like enzyme